MKLIFAVVNGDDSQAVSKALTKNGFFATKLASTGGFLSAGNTTFMICTDNEKVDRVIEIISQKSHKRKQFVPSASSYGVGAYTAFPVEVSVGGATIFVTDVERFEKVRKIKFTEINLRLILLKQCLKADACPIRF